MNECRAWQKGDIQFIVFPSVPIREFSFVLSASFHSFLLHYTIFWPLLKSFLPTGLVYLNILKIYWSKDEHGTCGFSCSICLLFFLLPMHFVFIVAITQLLYPQLILAHYFCLFLRLLPLFGSVFLLFFFSNSFLTAYLSGLLAGSLAKLAFYVGRTFFLLFCFLYNHYLA